MAVGRTALGGLLLTTSDQADFRVSRWLAAPLSMLFWASCVLLVILWTLFPVLWILSLSFKPESGINNEKFLPDSFTFDNYRTVFDTSLFTSALRNSVGISLIATVLAVIFVVLLRGIGIARSGSDRHRGGLPAEVELESARDARALLPGMWCGA